MKYNGENVTIFCQVADKHETTIFLLLGNNGPGAFQETPIRKAYVITWERLWVAFANLYNKAKIREERKRNGTYVYGR